MSLPDESPSTHDDYPEFAVYNRLREQITNLPALKVIPPEIKEPKYPSRGHDNYYIAKLETPISNEGILEAITQTITPSSDLLLIGFYLNFNTNSLQLSFGDKPLSEKDQDAINNYYKYMDKRQNLIEQNIELTEAAKTLYPKQWKACSKKNR